MATEFEIAKMALAMARAKAVRVAADLSTVKEEVRAAEDKMKSVCHHPEEACKDKHHWVRGNYYDREYTDYWRECSICGTKSDVKTVYGSYG